MCIRDRCCKSDIVLSSHACCCCQYSVTADEIAALADGFPREPHGFVIVTPAELRVGSDAIIQRGKRVARTEAKSSARGEIGFLPASAVGQGQPIICLRKREVRIKPQREFKLGQRVVKSSPEQ